MATSSPVPAKRRRLNVDTKLSKPFKSPLRRDGANSGTGSGESAIGPSGISPSTPVKMTSTSRKQSTETALFATQSQQTLSQTTDPISPQTPQRGTTEDTGFSELQTPLSRLTDHQYTLKHQRIDLHKRLFVLRQELDTVQQALNIEQSKQDAELEALIFKWKVVSREAAEELFGFAKEKVERMGGVAAWKESMKGSRSKGGGDWGWEGDEYGDAENSEGSPNDIEKKEEDDDGDEKVRKLIFF